MMFPVALPEILGCPATVRKPFFDEHHRRPVLQSEKMAKNFGSNSETALAWVELLDHRIREDCWVPETVTLSMQFVAHHLENSKGVLNHASWSSGSVTLGRVSLVPVVKTR